MLANDDNFQLLVATTSLLKLDVVEKIDEASNGLEALEFVKNQTLDKSTDPYDVIILDLCMPIMDGHQACQKIIQHYKYVRKEVNSNYMTQQKVKDKRSQLLSIFNDAFLQTQGYLSETEHGNKFGKLYSKYKFYCFDEN